jgi:hypothetical protein
MVRPNYNLIRFIYRAIQAMKKEYGSPITVYRLNSTTTNMQTGAKTVSRDSIFVRRAVVLPNSLTRAQMQTISVISANKQIVQGGTYDPGQRRFIIDRRDVPDWEMGMDDWIVYNDKRYEFKTVEEFEQSTAWLITAREVKGGPVHQDHHAKIGHYLGVTDTGGAS